MKNKNDEKEKNERRKKYDSIIICFIYLLYSVCTYIVFVYKKRALTLHKNGRFIFSRIFYSFCAFLNGKQKQKKKFYYIKCMYYSDSMTYISFHKTITNINDMTLFHVMKNKLNNICFVCFKQQRFWLCIIVWAFFSFFFLY